MMASTAVDVWDCDLAPRPGRGAYVAVSGNTAAGKSSLIATLQERLRADGVDAIGVSERIFHHQYLRLMFTQPADFAFPIQLSFMINRHMVLLRNLIELGRTVIVERSHLDDELFVREHLHAGSITQAQYEAYRGIAAVLHARLPAPDVMVLMNPAPALSLHRLGLAERTGERPSEFPTEEAKAAWVNQWYQMYVDLHASFRRLRDADPMYANMTLVEADPTQDRDLCADHVLGAIRSHLYP